MKNLKFYNGFYLNGIRYAEYLPSGFAKNQSYFFKNNETISCQEYRNAYIIYLNKIERN